MMRSARTPGRAWQSRSVWVPDSTAKGPRSNDTCVARPTSAEEVVRDFMEAFVEAWPTGNAVMLGRFFSEDAEYCNGPLAPVHGREAIVADLAGMMTLGGEVEADVRHLLSDGAIVMTERVDCVRLGSKTASLRVAGVFICISPWLTN